MHSCGVVAKNKRQKYEIQVEYESVLKSNRNEVKQRK